MTHAEERLFEVARKEVAKLSAVRLDYDRVVQFGRYITRPSALWSARDRRRPIKRTETERVTGAA